MKNLVRSIPVVAACLLFLGVANAGPLGPGPWHEIHPSFTVQNRTSAPLNQRYTNVNGLITTTVFAGEQRVELRWATWPNQNTYNQFECDAMFDSGTQHTAIHQIKSNTAGEPIYIQVAAPGQIRNDNGSVLMSGMANTWFHVNSFFNPSNNDARLYINGSLVVTRTFHTGSRDFYFKNGVYNNGLPAGGRSRAQFRNIHHYSH
jgi:hypothetical protein